MSVRSLGRLTLDLVARVGGFQQGMDAAARTADQRMRQIQQRARQFGRAFGIALAAGVTALAVGVRGAINDMDDLAKAAQRTGVEVEQLSTLQFAAQLSGVQNLEGGIKSLNRALGEAGTGSEQYASLFQALQVEVKDTEGNLRSVTDVMLDVADRFQSLPDGAEKTFIATRLRIRELLPLLNQGSEGILELQERARELGLEVDTGAAQAAERFNDRLTEVRASATGLWRQLAAELLPDLEQLAKRLADSTKEGGGLKGTVDVIANSVRALTILVKSLTSAFAAFGRAAGAAAAIGNNFVQLAQDTRGAFARGGGGRQQIGDALTRFSAGNLAISEGVAEDNASAFRSLRETLSPILDRMRGIVVPVMEEIEEATDKSTEANGELQNSVRKLFEEQNRATSASRALAEARRDEERAARELERIDREYANAKDQLNGILRAQAEIYDGPAETAARKYADSLLELLMLEQQLIDIGKLGQEEVLNLAQARDEASRQYRAALNDIAADATLALVDELESGAGEAADGASVFWDEAARRIQGSLADAIFDGMTGNYDDILSKFGELLTRMAAEAAAKELGEILFGGGQGGDQTSGFLQSLFGSFGGGREHGGKVYPNQAYVVGERRAELFVPDQAGTIVPRVPEGGGGGMVNNYNFAEPYNNRTQQQIDARRARDERMAMARARA